MKKKFSFWQLGGSAVRRLGFSLVELMISLIVISIVTAAFAPVISKKLGLVDKSYWGNTYVVNYEEK